MVETHLCPSSALLLMKMNLSLREKLASRKHHAKRFSSLNQLHPKFSNQGKHQRNLTRAISRDASAATFMLCLLPVPLTTKYWSSCLEFQIKYPTDKRSRSCCANCLSARRLQLVSSALPSTLSVISQRKATNHTKDVWLSQQTKKLLIFLIRR